MRGTLSVVCFSVLCSCAGRNAVGPYPTSTQAGQPSSPSAAAPVAAPNAPSAPPPTRPEQLVAWASKELTVTGVFLEDVAAGRSDPILEALKEALLLDERFAPTYDRLAIYYLQRSRLGRPRPACSGGYALLSGLPASSEVRRPDSQRIELARKAYLMGLAIDPESASLHNTAALVEAEDEHFDVATRELETAVRLRPSFVEAQLNMGALALRLRDFARAERAYRAAIPLLPNSYDAHLGLADALQGKVGPIPSKEEEQAILAELNRCDDLDPTRPEAIFNVANFFFNHRWHPDCWMNMQDGRALWGEVAKRSAADPWYAEASEIAQSWMDETSGRFISRARPRPQLVGQCPGGRL